MNLNRNFEYLHIGLPDDILRRKLYGDFEGAIRLIDRKLAMSNLPQPQKSCLIVQRELISRLAEDYPLTRREAVALVQRHIPDFTEAEFDALEADGRIDWIYDHGVPHYFNRFFDSLCKTDAAFAARAGLPHVLSDGSGDGDGKEAAIDRVARLMRERGAFSNRILVRATMQMNDEAFIPGETVLAHLPIPCACAQQSDIRIERVEPPTGVIAPVDAPQRTVCWQEQMQQNHPFAVEYSYIHTARYNDLSRIVPDAVQPDFDTGEQPPHILFTPYIRTLVQTLSEGMPNPLEKARAFYDFITLNVKYSFVRAYFGLENIAEQTARNLVGDCGMQALLFITLCRCAGIPARWQSGLHTRPDFCGAHDWAMFYIAPYGWLYADPSFGGGAVREHNEARRRFYFGNLDAFRMVANSQFQAPFTQPKQQWRADPYDNQVGEIETPRGGLRYADFTRTKEVLRYDEL